jgi:hypothetical protein
MQWLSRLPEDVKEKKLKVCHAVIHGPLSFPSRISLDKHYGLCGAAIWPSVYCASMLARRGTAAARIISKIAVLDI